MSIPLPTINLANVSINQTGTVSFANAGISAGGVSANPTNIKNAGTIVIYNESGTGLLIVFHDSNSGFYLPAGGWQAIPIRGGETGYTWTAIYNLPNPPVTLLLTTYYYPGEPIPAQPTLGNSPIGIGGNVQTSSVQTLSNEGNSVQTLIIDIGQVGNTQLITINSDGSATWSVLRSGVAHQIFKIQIGGTSPILIGQSGDASEVLGKLFVDGLSKLDGGAISSDGSGNMSFNQVLFQSGSITHINGGNALIANTGTVINHGLGVTPDVVVVTPNLAQPGTEQVGIGSIGPTSFTATSSNASSFLMWLAIKF